MNFWLTAMLNLIVASPLCQWPCVEWVQRANGFVNTKSFLLVRRSRSMASVGSVACDIGAPPSPVDWLDVLAGRRIMSSGSSWIGGSG